MHIQPKALPVRTRVTDHPTLRESQRVNVAGCDFVSVVSGKEQRPRQPAHAPDPRLRRSKAAARLHGQIAYQRKLCCMGRRGRVMRTVRRRLHRQSSGEDGKESHTQATMRPSFRRMDS